MNHFRRNHLLVLRAILLAAILLTGRGGVDSSAPAAELQDASGMLSDSGVRGGLVVHLGCGDGSQTAALHASERFLVQGLDTDPLHVAAAREHIRSAGLYGKVSIDQLTGNELPYADNLVNLLVAEDLGSIPASEVMRVLAPAGVAYLRSDGKWSKTTKPRPKEIDEWTHCLHGPDNNAVGQDEVVGPPAHIQWLAGPKYSRSHEHLSSLSAAVSAAGRLFYIVDLGPLSSVALPAEWHLIARDAFSGVVLWQRPLRSWEDHMLGSRAGASQLGRRLVAVNDRVYVTLGFGEPVTAIDAATGDTVREYSGTEGTREILCDKNRLYLVAGDADPASDAAAESKAARRGVAAPPASRDRILVVDAETSRMLWSKSDADTTKLRPGTIAVRGSDLFYMRAGEVLCLDAESGREKWRAARPIADKLDAAATLVVYNDVVLTADMATTSGPKADTHRSELVAFSAATGDKLWTHESAELYVSPTNVLVANGLVWSGRMWSVVDPGVTEAWDPKTGEVRLRKPPETPEMLGMSHHRCYRDRATDRYLVLGRVGVEFLDTHSGEMTFNHWVRGMCQFGVLPCNGLVYVTPHPCACYVEALFNGFSALAPKRPGEPTRIAEPSGAQLEHGPAYPSISNNQSAACEPDDWPTYRHDAARSGVTQATVSSELQIGWQSKVGGRLSGAVAANGQVFVASIDEHTVLALNAEDGSVLWRYTAGARVDSPPTIHRGLVLFGSADGYVYCLRASDGQLAWRFRAAPEDRRIVSQDQLESISPVNGSVLIDNDVAYFATGRSSYVEGGIFVYRLNPVTGERLSVTRIDSRDPKTGGQPKEAIAWIRGFDMPGSLPDVLSCQDGTIFMRRTALDRQGLLEDSHKPHLYSPAGYLDDSRWHRTYWLYGDEKGSGPVGWTNGARQYPSGEILVSDGKQVYGYGRNNYSVHGSHPRLGLTQYRLFRADAKPRELPEPTAGSQQTVSPVNYQWTVDVPLFPQAIVLAGETLWVAGVPDLPTPEDASASLEGRKGGVLIAVSASDGKVLSQRTLDTAPVFDGMAVANKRLYLSLQDGRILCFKD